MRRSLAMGTASVLSLVFGGLSALAALFAPLAFVSALRARQRSRVTTGTVVAVENDVANSSWIVHVRYEVEGRQFTLRIGSNGGYTRGEPVQVRYLADDPARAFPASGGVWLETAAALVLAAVFGAVALLFVFLGRAGVL